MDRYKSRLVILGCKQQYGVDFIETFALMAKMTIVRALLAIAVIYDWFVFQMDVTNAFLHGDLFEDVYMTLPQVYTGIGSRITLNWSGLNSSNLVCKLKKSLYGIRQAPRQWFSKLSETLLSSGYTQSKSDYSLFTHTSSQAITMILVYVDDLLLAGNCIDDISNIKCCLVRFI